MEGFGLTFLEAQYYGKRIIAFDVGAVSEVAIDSSIILKEYNYQILADAIVEVLTSCGGKGVLATTNITFKSWIKTVKDTVNVYEKL
jgi:glycosyltransferase involved in cell wall biosynthesis